MGVRWRAGYVATLCGCVDSTITVPQGAPFQAVDAGVVKYDPQQESACIEALQAEGCAQWDFPLGLPPVCAAAFTCASDAGTDDAGPADGAAADAGGGCNAAWSGFLQPCSTNADCTGAVAPAGPYCFDGYCYPTPCGYFDFVDGSSFVGSGLVIGTGDVPTTLGVCATPQDIGGPCVQGAGVTGCMKGLVCPCGTCRPPPSQGPCVSDSCEVDVSYCDIPSGTCQPVKQLGGACAAIGNQCATDLHCDSTTNTCQPGQP
jgi:hypothetical protein